MKKDIKILFGKRVRQLRTRKKLIQLDIAAKLNTDVRQISRVELGQVNTKLETIEKLAEALDCKITELFDFDQL